MVDDLIIVDNENSKYNLKFSYIESFGNVKHLLILIITL